MKDVIEFLTNNPVQYFGTVGIDNKAKCRPFMFSGEHEGKLWFCTSHNKDVYAELQTNPYIEVTTSSSSYAWIRINGKAIFENNVKVKEMCFENPIVSDIYQTIDNPTFEVFYIEDARAVIADFSGQPAKSYIL